MDKHDRPYKCLVKGCEKYTESFLTFANRFDMFAYAFATQHADSEGCISMLCRTLLLYLYFSCIKDQNLVFRSRNQDILPRKYSSAITMAAMCFGHL